MMMQGGDFFSPYPGRGQHHQPLPSAGDARYRNPRAFGQGPLSAPPAAAPMKRTLNPYVVGASVVAVKYSGGVLAAADMLGSYGSLARFRSIPRLRSVGKTLIGASGDISDYQYIMEDLIAKETREFCEADGFSLDGREIWNYMTRRMYAARNKNDPLYNQLVVASVINEQPFLAHVDLHGTSFEDDHLASGYGAHLARPILRNEWKVDMSKTEAQELLTKCMTVLFYRDCRTINKIQFADVTSAGVEVAEPVELATDWQIGVKTYSALDTGSW
eukprot:TRINITY_DN355_c0_g2_i1.p1 TRINITY_DN355_c0_g2~~TRINITY_DN355_c0_g2_i1.p1  ORF type:complete len:307 (+),score=46.33 TRINITY_DN355_c0_g2_i1:102-923(+)